MPRMRPVNHRGGAREGAGRPRDGSSERTDQRRAVDIFDIMQNFEYEQVAKAFIKFTTEERGENFGDIVENAIFKLVNRRRVLINDAEANLLLKKFGLTVPEPLESSEGLSLLLHESLSKRKYTNIRKTVNGAGKITLLPGYNHVAQAKLECRPATGIEITEVKATVRLQDLVEHTTQRILKIMGDKTDNSLRTSRPRRKRRSCSLVFSYGFDGASGQRNFKQSYEDRAYANRSDSSLFAATLNPLLLKEESGLILWQNTVPQSPLYVRPLLIEFEKETAAYVER